MNLQDLYQTQCNWLIYSSYEFNRMSNPHIPFKRWRTIFKDALELEKIFDKLHNKKEEENE
jgi:hypothetical protein